MKLSEKILYCRKKSGLSQEALAQKLNVSRQAVSKWETGEAMPDLNNLALLAKEFDVTADWLISEEEPVEATHSQTQNESSAWLDHVPGFIGKMLKKYGWIFGIYLAVVGALFAGFGAIAKFVSEVMLGNFNSTVGNMFPTGTGFYEDPINPFGKITSFNPVSIVGTVILVLGVIMIIAGIVLAVVLKKKNSK